MIYYSPLERNNDEEDSCGKTHEHFQRGFSIDLQFIIAVRTLPSGEISGRSSEMIFIIECSRSYLERFSSIQEG